LILGGEIQLRLDQIGFLPSGHRFSPEKGWLVAVTTETAPKTSSWGGGEYGF
jgi:hypothetical protein